MNDELPPFVRSVAPGIWVLEGAEKLVEQLGELDATISVDGGCLVLRHSPTDDSAMAEMAMRLRALGFYFSDGRDWSPKAYVHHLRDIGLFTGPVSEISWSGPGRFSLREN